MRRLISAVFLAGLVLLAGCSRQTADKAPNIRYGKDACAECRMIIGEKKCAAALIGTDGESVKFDDIGCMKAYLQKNAMTAKYAWVHDYQSDEWIDQRKAVFVRSEYLVTPMGYGIAAFSATQASEQFLADHAGQKISWDEISETLRKDHE